MQQSLKEKAADNDRAALARQQEYMSLVDGVGIVPKKFRNLGYKKLDFKPGEGGLGNLLTRQANQPIAAPAPAADERVSAFLAGVASGADPKELAEKLLLASTPTAATDKAGKEILI